MRKLTRLNEQWFYDLLDRGELSILLSVCFLLLSIGCFANRLNRQISRSNCDFSEMAGNPYFTFSYREFPMGAKGKMVG